MNLKRPVFYNFLGSFLVSLIGLLVVYLFNLFIGYFSVDSPTSENYWNVTIFFCITKLLSVFFKSQVNYMKSQSSFMCQRSLNFLIFKKITNQSPAGLKQKIDEWKLINFILVDSMRMGLVILALPSIIVFPFRILFLFLWVRWSEFEQSFVS